MKHTLLIVTFFFLSFSVFSQTTLEEIKQLSDIGKYDIALNKVLQLIKTDSLNADLWNETGELQVLNKKYNDATTSFRRTLQLDSSMRKTYLSLANAYLKSGRNRAAVETYKSLLQKDSTNVAALSKLAQIYFKSNTDLAYIQYEKLYSSDTLNTSYLLMMAKCLLLDNDAFKALDLLKKAFRKDSSNMRVAIYLNKMYSDFNVYDTAMIVINKAIAQYPDEGHLYFRRGSTQFTKNYHFRSVPDFKKAMELGYKSDALINRLAKSLFMTKKYKESRDYFNELLERQDTIDYQVCMYMGNIYNEFGDADSALLFLNKAIQLITPDNLVMSSIHAGKANSYKLKKDYKKQIEHITTQYEYLSKRGFSIGMYHHKLQIALIYDKKLNNKKAALRYYTDYYDSIKDKAYVRDKEKEKLVARINRLKEDLHFSSPTH